MIRRLSRRPGVQLLALVLLIASTWGIVLPWIGQWQPIRTRIEFLNSQGVDPSALYYTDLEAMPRLEAAVTAKLQRIEAGQTGAREVE